MIIGTGIDIIEIERIGQAIERWGEDFLRHIFNDEEIKYVKTKKFPNQHYAARFAAKEAIYKAFGDNKTLGWKDMTILNDEHGRPYCKFKDASITSTIHLSITHTKNYAAANAIITD